MYKLQPDTLTGKAFFIHRISDNTFIPMNPANTDYQVYLKWLDGYELQGMEWVKTSDGNTPLPADEPSEGTA
jgi:hypothetical protein